MYGHGIEPNIEDALLFFEKSAQLKEPRAFVELGKIYESGHGVRINIDKALEYYKQAEEYNNATAFYKIGKMY